MISTKYPNYSGYLREQYKSIYSRIRLSKGANLLITGISPRRISRDTYKVRPTNNRQNPDRHDREVIYANMRIN